MDNAKYENISEDNNKELDEHINPYVNYLKDGSFFELDDKHNLVIYDKVRTKNEENKDE